MNVTIGFIVVIIIAPITRPKMLQNVSGSDTKFNATVIRTITRKT